MQAVIDAIKEEIAQEEHTHADAMRQLRELLDAAETLGGQRTDAAPEAPPLEPEGDNETPSPEGEAAPEPDDEARGQKWDPGDLTGGAMVGGAKPVTSMQRPTHATPTRAPGQQARGADAARAIGEANRDAVRRYLLDAYAHDRGGAAGAGWRTPAEIREATELSKDKVRGHCAALVDAGLAELVGTTKDRRYRLTRKGRAQSPTTQEDA